MLSRIAKGGVWISLGEGSERIARFIRNMILARLLAPEIFGLMAIVLSVSSLLESFTEVGIKKAIVQHPEGDRKTYLNGAWWFSACRGFILYFLAFILSPTIASFYENPALSDMMRVAFLGIFFNGLFSAKAYVTLKKMDLRTWSLIFNGGGLIGIVITLILAIHFSNIWALIIGFCAEAFFRLILSYIFCPFLPGFQFDKVHLKALFKFTSGMIGLPVMYFIFMKADIFVIGKVCSPEELGLYSMAANLARMPLDFIVVFTDQLLMPIFSEMQSDKSKINRLLNYSISFVVFLSMPVVIIALFAGKDILSIVYGSKYATVALSFGLVMISEIIRVSSTPIVTAYLSIGKPELHRLFNIIRVIVIIAIIYPFIKLFGLPGAPLACITALVVALVFQLFRLNKLIDYRPASYLLIFMKALLPSLLIVAIYFLIDRFSFNSWIRLCTGAAVCMIVYWLTILLNSELRYIITNRESAR